MKLLVVEDEQELSDSILTYLNSENYQCEQAFTCGEARTKTAACRYDCILFDLMLPDGDGLDLLRELRERHVPSGIIIVSAKDAPEDKVYGLEMGADDYMSKPFFLPELGMRISAVMRRRKPSGDHIIRSNGIVLDVLAKSVYVNGLPVALTPTEYELLLFFLNNCNRVISKSSLAEHLSGRFAGMLGSSDFVYTHIKNLKLKLLAAGSAGCIKNIYGTGYKWME